MTELTRYLLLPTPEEMQTARHEATANRLVRIEAKIDKILAYLQIPDSAPLWLQEQGYVDSNKLITAEGRGALLAEQSPRDK